MLPKIIDDMSRDDIEHLIDQYVHHERNRKIYKRRILDGILFEQLAEEFGLSVRQIQNIVYRCERDIFSKVMPENFV